MDVATLLANTLSPDRVAREDATQKLELFAQENFANYAIVLCQLLANDQVEANIRMSAGLVLKNSLSAKDLILRDEKAARWLSLDNNSRAQIKQGALFALASNSKPVGNTAGQVIAAIAEIELPVGQWPDLIRTLLENVTVPGSTSALKQATLQTIGYVCESTNPSVLEQQSNEILTAIVQGAHSEEQDQEVRLAAIRALINSMEFIKGNFEREGERNFIMQVVCEATQSVSTEVMAAAFECLVRIMQLYYDKMHFYMEKALFGLTVAGMNHPEENVALQAIEFWSTVCDEETLIKEEIADAAEVGEQPERSYYGFAEAASRDILPVLLWLLPKKDEDEDEDEWNVSMAAATCLSLFAQCVGNLVIEYTLPFVESNIQHSEWRNREAAVMAYGSILDGPDAKMLTPLVERALPPLINMMRDPVVNVKDTVAWTLGRICELHVHCIKPEVHLHELIASLLIGLQDSPRIVSNCCWSLMNLAEQMGPALGSEEPTSALSVYYEGVIPALLQFTNRSDNESNCRTSAYEAISSLVMFSANDCIPIVQTVALAILDRIDITISMESQIVGSDERSEHSELQSCLLGVLTNCIRRLSRDIISVSDRIMSVLIQMLNGSSKQSTIAEDAFLAVGAMTSALESDFQRYTETFVPLLCAALQNPAEHQLCHIAVGLVGDLCRALGEGVLPFCNTFMQLLVSNLQSPVLHRVVKPSILSCFGDIALAIESKFEPYLEVVLMALQQAGSMRSESDNYEMIDYINSLREGIVEAYVGIVQGMSKVPQLLLPHMSGIFMFMQIAATDSNRSYGLSRSLIGLLGDLAETFGSQLKQGFQEPWVAALLREGRTSRHYDSSTKETARWAKEMIKRACH